MEKKISQLGAAITPDERALHGVQAVEIKVDWREGNRELADVFLDRVQTIVGSLLSPRISVRDDEIFIIGYQFKGAVV